MQLVLDSVRAITRFYPPALQAEMESALPDIALEASRLALEVMQAERDGVPYAEAVRRIDFPLMGRVHFGLQDLLQQRLPKALRNAVRGLAEAASGGEFDDLRAGLFADAADRSSVQSALLRFLLYESTRIGLLVLTWELPELEALGALGRIDREAQAILSGRLAMPEMHDGRVRPLHLLVADLALRAFGDAETVRRAVQEREETVAFVLELIEATRTIRSLDAPFAAVAHADAYEEEMDSQRLVDTYPWHFQRANDVDQRRSRLRKMLKAGKPPVVVDGSRLIDIILAEQRKEERSHGE